MYPVRNSVKALIIRANKLLCIRKTDVAGAYYLLPGGGQEKNETFIDTLERECREELGAGVEVGNLRYIREYIGKNHEFSADDDAHQVEFMFECRLLEEPDPKAATHVDAGQEGVEWIDLGNQAGARVYPKVLVERLRTGYRDLYWGDIN